MNTAFAQVKATIQSLPHPRPPNELPADTRGTYPFGVRLGLVFVVQTAFLSFFLVGGLLSMMIYEAVKRYRLRRLGWPPQIYMYFVSLLCSDFIQALGSIMNLRWIHEAGVSEGTFCTAQGVIKQMGDVGVALATIAIAVQTFGIIVGRWSRFTESHYVGIGVVSFIWIFLTLLIGGAVAAHHTRQEPFYGNTEYWCSIRYAPYERLFVALEYIWLWIALVISFVLYITVAIVVYRQRTVTDTESINSLTSKAQQIRKLAFQMLFYPLIYSFCILPQSIVRFTQFAHPHNLPPFGASAFAAVAFASSGLLNVLLFAYTRPSLLPHDPESDESKIRESGLEEQTDDMSIELASRTHSWQSDYHRGPFSHRTSVANPLGGLED